MKTVFIVLHMLIHMAILPTLVYLVCLVAAQPPIAPACLSGRYVIDPDTSNRIPVKELSFSIVSTGGCSLTFALHSESAAWSYFSASYIRRNSTITLTFVDPVPQEYVGIFDKLQAPATLTTLVLHEQTNTIIMYWKGRPSFYTYAAPKPPAPLACLSGRYVIDSDTSNGIPVKELSFQTPPAGECSVTFALHSEPATWSYFTARYARDTGGTITLTSADPVPQEYAQIFERLQSPLTLNTLLLYEPTDTIIMYWKGGVS